MKKTIGLAGEENGFLIRLLDYVNKKGEVEAFFCSDKESLAEEIRKREPEIMFILEGFMEDISAAVNTVPFVKEPDKKEGIYQYQSAANLYKEMRRHIWKETPCRSIQDEEKKLYAVYSPLGRSGKTSFACAYAKAHSFFYLGMEEYGFLTNDFCREGELLYHIKNRREGIGSYLLEHAEMQDGIYMFGAPIRYTDIRWLDAEDYRWFLKELRSDRRIPSVIVDFGSSCVTDFEILDYFDQVFLPILTGETEERKLVQYKELLYEMNGNMEGRLKEIMVPPLTWKHPEFLEKVRYMEGLTYE